MPAQLPKSDLPLAVHRPVAGEATPTPPSVQRFLEGARAELARLMPAAPGVQANRASRSRSNPPDDTEAQTPIDFAAVEDAIDQIQQLAWSYRTGWHPERDKEALALLGEVVALGQQIKTLPRQRHQVIVMTVLLERMVKIYSDYAGGSLEYDEYDGLIQQALTAVGIPPSSELLDELAVDVQYIRDPAYAEEGGHAKGAGPVETAKERLNRVFDMLGFDEPHSPRSLQKLRTMSPAERARLSASQPFGSNAMLAPGTSARTPLLRKAVELDRGSPDATTHHPARSRGKP